jgi:crotonobetainyl-CoA:carnitine CoA-transferase CaiB-like acyl-CoA transferase
VTYNHYKCSDDKWIAVAAIGGANLWPLFCQALGIEFVNQDPRFANPRDRFQHGRELMDIVEKTFLSKPRDEWLRIFNEHDIPVAPIYDYAEAALHPQITENQYVVTLDHPKWGKIQQVGLAVQLSKTPGDVSSFAPEVGEHTEELLSEVGYSPEQIAELRAEEVI